jgi:hypothetical protein
MNLPNLELVRIAQDNAGESSHIAIVLQSTCLVLSKFKKREINIL